MGITEEEAEARGVLIGEFPFAGLGIAHVLGKTEGSVRIFVDRKSHEILGARIRGPHAEELIRIITLAMGLKAKLEDLADLVYAHPTLPEAIGEAAESVLGNAVHLMPGKDTRHETGDLSPESCYDVVVVGSGPAGYVAAIRAAQLGQKVAVIEKDRPGGTCLIRGCIPTKAILEAVKSKEQRAESEELRAKSLGRRVESEEQEEPYAQGMSSPEIRRRVEKIVGRSESGVRALFRANGIMLIEGEANISDSDFTGGEGKEKKLEVRVDGGSVTAKNIILATGSRPASLTNVEINHKDIINSNDALELDIPDELTIVGAGSIGLEFAVIYKALGCRKVTVVEKEEHICPGMLDSDMAGILQKGMEAQGIAFHLGTGFDATHMPQGKVLMAVGRALNNRELSEKGIVLGEDGAVEVNDRYQVRFGDGGYAENVFAIGDITGRQLLAHKASKEGKVAAEVIAGSRIQDARHKTQDSLESDKESGVWSLKSSPVDYNQIPSVVFTIPEVASVGLTEETAGKSGKSMEVKYLQTSDRKNVIKVVLDTGCSTTGRDACVTIENRLSSVQHQVLGATIIGPSAPYAIAEMTLAISMDAALGQLMGEGLTLASAEETRPSEWEEKRVEAAHPWVAEREELRTTPLTEVHREAGAEMSDFHGWWLPMRYTDAYEEVRALRNNAAIWDIGHMAVLEVSGQGAKSFLQFLTTNDIDGLKVGQAQYSFFLDEKARPLDDVLVYRLWGRRYLIVVNAANREKIKRWMFSMLDTGYWIPDARSQAGIMGKIPHTPLVPPSSEHRISSIQNRVSSIEHPEIADLYDCPEEDKRVTMLSLQGPEAENILKELTDFDLDTLEYFHCKKIEVASKRMLVQRGGYTGEEGFEIFAPARYAVDLWKRIMEVGKRFGLKPAGLLARDIARQEACLPLYGNEWPEVNPYDEVGHGGLPPHITPYEAGFGWAVKIDKGDFIGREAYVKHLSDAKQGKIECLSQVAIELEGRWTAYQNYKVFHGQEVGMVTSGRFSEYLGKSIWLAYIKRHVACGSSREAPYPLGQTVEIEIGRDRVPGKIVPKPVVNNVIYPRRGDVKENAKYYITLTPKQADEMLHDTILRSPSQALESPRTRGSEQRGKGEIEKLEQRGKTAPVARDSDGVDSINALLPGGGTGIPDCGYTDQGLSRRKNYQYHARLARMNYSPEEYSSFLGAGSYDYQIPDVVNWAASLRGIYTPYTPYQSEVAQGLLRLFYIYQSQICQLAGMEVANASLYDGATALAEAAFMSVRITSTADKSRTSFLVAGPLHPFYYQVLETYAKDVGCRVIQVPFDEEKGTIDLEALQEKIEKTKDTRHKTQDSLESRVLSLESSLACVIIQQPNFFGQIESELREVGEIAHDAGALFISCTTDPHSLEILEAPAYYGADIAVGEAQAFGNPVNCGGPNLGFLATSKQYIREVPGRIVGRTEIDGKEAFCLIRQTREQHITRFKAKSNICSNTALCATRAALYMLTQGRTGLHEVNSTALTLKEFFLSQLLAIPGFELAFEGDSLNEVTVSVPIDPDELNKELLKRKCLGALNLGTSYAAGLASFSLRSSSSIQHPVSSIQYMLFSFTNRTTQADVEHLIDSLLDIISAPQSAFLVFGDPTDIRERVLSRREGFTGEIKYSPEGTQRNMPLNLPQYSESEIIRFARDMAALNIDIDAPLYPLGSCTMKYNPKLNEKIAALEGFSRVHPLAPDCAKQGTLKLAYDFSNYLCQITGMDAATLQPEAGAHGEFTGLKIIRAAQAKAVTRHNRARDLIITSDSSHGTNPASVAMAGMEVLEIPSDNYGMIDISAFRKAVEDNRYRFAGCMLTIPNTLGIFEPNIPEICQITHDYGGYVYMDGANFNALIGQIKVRDLGVDVMHFNLHKTFGAPHGGGGPGAGPVAVIAELEPYLPVPRVQYDEERDHYWLDWSSGLQPASRNYEYSHSIGKVSTFFGPYGVVIKANAYRMALGEEGMFKVSETAILNANYMLKRIMSEAVDENGEPLFRTIYKPEQYCMHEFVISSERFEKHNISAIDFAKGVIDSGVYAPTVGFPLFFDHGRHAIMVEPTDTATREGMDYYCDKFIELAREAWKNPEILKNAPSKLRFRRISVADADRELDVSANIHELLPDCTPVSGGEVVEKQMVSFARRKVVTQVEGVKLPDIPEEIDPGKAKFMEEGEWAFDLGGGFALCGLSKETVEMIKELKFTTIHLPKLGAEIEEGEDTGASVDFDKVASPIYAPVSGRVVKINPLFVDEENLDILINEPYKRGWLFVVQKYNNKEEGT